MTGSSSSESDGRWGVDRRIGVSPPPRGDRSGGADDGPPSDRPAGPDTPERSPSPPPAGGGLDLDVAGFTEDPGGALPRGDAEADAGRPDRGGDGPRRKTTLLLPHRLIGAVRRAADRQDCILAEVIIEAYIAHGEAVGDQLVDDEAVRRRAAMGLPPPPAPRPRSAVEGEERGQLPISVSADALEVLDDTAEDLGVSRSHLVEELLERRFSGRAGSGPADPSG